MSYSEFCGERSRFSELLQTAARAPEDDHVILAMFHSYQMVRDQTQRRRKEADNQVAIFAAQQQAADAALRPSSVDCRRIGQTHGHSTVAKYLCSWPKKTFRALSTLSFRAKR